ncbi:ribonuclease III [Alysiella crassa]|uniref:Ribonuclease 3 n=1 Tax=Alysiella crassa TaxID=153491 RepID=A0A376BN90_9NEIS|nr:ribonuclease III [Alysiella crassa]UOP06756.1 ribonuclease III [Alysiella crassa]SSY71130.1 Ribonuclease 3 [Alysiella crassa]
MRPTPRDTAQLVLQQKLNYQFKNKNLLQQALTHRSHSPNNYERLEFIGDSILDYVIAKMLYEAFPKLPEGRLSPIRAQLVKEATLADVARELKLGDALLLGVGELKSGGHDRASILADALEAVFAAISLDADFQAAEKIVRQLFRERIKQLDTNNTAKDAKTQLQEILQGHKLALPKYRIEQQIGEGNEARFDVSCDLGELGKIFYANANSRRAAEQDCAKQALAWLAQKLKK